MNKVVRDGKVAVVHTKYHGAGWYSWSQIDEFLFDPTLIKMVEDKAEPEDIEKYVSSQPWVGDGYHQADQLTVSYVPQGLEFVILEYDGLEFIVLKNEITWVKA
jgi:hypothetical protein